MTHAKILVTYRSRDYVLLRRKHISMFLYTANNLTRKQGTYEEARSARPPHHRDIQWRLVNGDYYPDPEDGRRYFTKLNR